jgi:hypothetical protein
MQTREFESNRSQLVSVFITVFQDAGYTLEQADLATGLIVARAPAEKRPLTIREFNPNTLLKFDFQETTFSGVILETSRTITVLVTEVTTNRTKARVSMMVQKKIGGFTTLQFSPHEGPETDPEQYQAIFSKIQQALFLKKNLE